MQLHCTGLQRKLLCLPLQGHISLNSIAIKNEQVSPGHTGILFCRANEHRLRGLGSYCSALSGLNTTSTCGHMLTYMVQRRPTPPPPPPPWLPPPYGPYYAAFSPRPPVVRVVWVVRLFTWVVLTPAHPPVVWWWVLGLTPPPSPPL